MSMGENPYNPYAPPNAEPEAPRTPSVPIVLASRGQRLAGAIVDRLFWGLLGFGPAAALHFAGLDPIRTTLSADPDSMWRPSAPLLFFMGLIPTSYQWWLISRSGQSLGKKLNKTRIVTRGGEAAGFLRGAFLREMPNMTLRLVDVILLVYWPAHPWLVWSISLFSSVDPLLIFGPSKRCLHDYIAGTVVITGRSTKPG